MEIDAEVVRQAQSGDRDGLRKLVEGAYSTVRRWALVRTGDPTDAEDLTQDVMIQMIRKLDGYRGTARFSTWLYTITRHAASDRFRHARRQADLVRDIFQFAGYRLAGEAFVTATDWSHVEQGLGANHMLKATVAFVRPGTIRLDGVSLSSYEGGDRLTTTVNIRPGQTLVLGTASRAGEDVTLLLTVRAEEVVG